MNNKNFSEQEKDMINKMRNARSEEELLKSIPADVRDRLNNVMNNENELKRILNSERAKALYDKIKELEEFEK